MARALGSNALVSMAYETVYGTAPASGYKAMAFADTSLGTEQPLIDNELLGYGRDPLAPSRDAITSDGNITIPVDSDGIGYWLKALLGAPVTTGTTPKIHTFTSGLTALPSMSIEVGNPEVPYYEMFSGVTADRMDFDMKRSGLLQAKVGLIAQGSTGGASSGAGTVAAVALQRFGHFNGSIKRNGTVLGSVQSCSFSYANNLDRVETIRADGKIDGLDPSIAAMSGKLETRFDSSALLTQAIGGTSCSLEFSWTISASISLVITAHAVYLPVPRRTIDGPKGIMANFDWQAAKAVSPARMMTAVLTNSVVSY